MPFNRTRFDSVAKFRSWLIEQGEKEFDYTSNTDCLFASWAKDCGGENVNCLPIMIEVDGQRFQLPMIHFLALERYRKSEEYFFCDRLKASGVLRFLAPVTNELGDI